MGPFDDVIPQVYGAGAPESGQQASPQQQAYAAAGARFRDAQAPAGTAANPSYDTPTVTGAPESYHVNAEGRLSDPSPDVSLGPFADLLPGGAVHPRTDEVLGLEKGAGEGFDNMWNRAASSPLISGALDRADTAFPILGFAHQASRGLSRAAVEDAAQKEAAGAIPGKTGEFLGNAFDTAALPGGPLTQGALSGLMFSHETTPLGVGMDMAKGALGGKIASKLIGGAAGIVSPNVAPHVSTLIREGVPVTAGQIVGGALRRVEDTATHLPIIGDAIRNAQRRSIEGLNIAIPNRALAPIGEKVPANVAPGREAIAYAGDKLSEGYNKLLPTLTIQPDGQFGQDMASLASQAATNLTADHYNQLGRIIKSTIVDKIDPATGHMAPQAMQDAETGLNQRISRLSKSPMPEHQDLADALTATRTMLRDLVSRNNPQAAPQLQALREGWANLVIGENAAKSLGAEDGIVTPSMLANAVRKSDDTVRNRGYARGTALMQDLSDAALSRLPSTVPDSGSAGRLALEAGVAAGVGKEAHLPLGKAMAVGSILSAPYSPAGQKFTQAMLAGNRPAIAPDIAAILNKIKPVARAAGAVALPKLLGATTGS